jgi:hypothetical protein
MIWAEMGIVGLTLHLFILFYVIGMASLRLCSELRSIKLKRVRSGMAGLWSHRMVMKLLGQITSLLIYASMAMLTNPELLKELQKSIDKN